MRGGDLFLYDDATARKFEPFALTRPAGEMRAGALLVRERWEHVLRRDVAGHVTAPHLASFDEAGSPRAITDRIAAGAILANARFCAPLNAQWPDADAWRNDGRIVAVKLRRAVDVESLNKGRVPLDDLFGESSRVLEVPGLWMDHVWSYIERLTHMLAADIEVLAGRGTRFESGGSVTGKHGVFVEDGALVEPHVFFDTTGGPVLIRSGATVQAFTRIGGPCVIGAHSIVGVDKISACSIGDNCRVHGELSVSIVLGHSNKSHDGFVGHSYLGRWVNLGAGTITSNLKNTYGTVQLWTPDGVRDTGVQFLGTLFGDHAKTGIGTTLSTGTVIGAGANVFGTAIPPKAISPFAWGDHSPYSTYQLAKFLDVADRVMQRRHVELTAAQATMLSAAYKHRWSAEPKKKKKR